MQDRGAPSVTLVLTDVVDSTQLAAQLGDARNAALWDHHDRVARGLVATWNGQEVERTDGILALFPSPDQALGFALAYQSALRTLDPPLVARVGIHRAGPTDAAEVPPRGTRRVQLPGLSPSVASRVLSIARGGQILLTRDAVPQTDHRVTPHGHWRVKGAPEPVELFEIRPDDAPGEPPPDGEAAYRVVREGDHWLPVRQIPHALPAEWDRFVGRRPDLLALMTLLDDGARLVSVTGVGGSGKTRLVTHFGWTHLGDYPGGVWFCDLSEARDVQGVLYAVAAALDVPLGQLDPTVQLGHAIAGRGQCLVVLDNFEQVARHAADTVGRWRTRAPEAAFVITTREVLGLPREATLTLPPLVEADAVDLFAVRAASAKHGFEIGPDNRDDVQALVGLLDRLPLAIELAAARVRVLSPKALLGRMSERFRLLTSRGARVDRQATLRATLDWSWELLSADEQAALAQLSVFEGGFGLEAAEAVVSCAGTRAVDAVHSLVRKSLVRPVTDDRFDLLVSVQTYAADRLQAGGARGAAEVRHGTHFAQRGAPQAVTALWMHGGTERRRALVRDLDNVVVACRRAIVRADADVAGPTLRAAFAVLELRGPVGLAAELADEVGALAELDPSSRAACRVLQGRARWRLGTPDEPRAHYEAALVTYRETGDRHGEGFALGNLGALHYTQGRMAEATRHFDAALTIHRDIGDRHFEGVWRGLLGLVCADLGQTDEAIAHYDAALAIHREVGNRPEEGVVLGNLGNARRVQGRVDDARVHHDDALAIHREIGDRRAEGVGLGNLGDLDLAEGRPDEARVHLEAALAIHREVGHRGFEGEVLASLGQLHLAQGRVDDAAEHYEAALEIDREVGSRRSEGIVLARLGHLHADRGHRADAERCWDAGASVLREVGHRVGLGELLAQRAALEAAWDLPTARTHLAQAEDLVTELQAEPETALVHYVVEARAALASLGAPSAPSPR